MKIVLVINSIISHQEKISNIIANGDEIFFLYDGKHKWSVDKIAEEYIDTYIVNFYPQDGNENKVQTLEQIIDLKMFGSPVRMATYTTRQYSTTEAYETFKDLYEIVFNKVYGIDDIFDSIISEL
ncbi:hypothetical protein NJT12_03420 [Flavobacterium sp. AC]|uniref:Uncharacterized protein n=1 Tax=Flavobacterium azizsancarii TaxID=2961580 RepID=A0ABT4W7X2_9FLAO|nr:hypothetical protein [Flavobacterium azizsancarii]MDA6068661.1 hypothetical protein [Flavobacterium azizsancarii]